MDYGSIRSSLPLKAIILMFYAIFLQRIALPLQKSLMNANWFPLCNILTNRWLDNLCCFTKTDILATARFFTLVTDHLDLQALNIRFYEHRNLYIEEKKISLCERF